VLDRVREQVAQSLRQPVGVGLKRSAGDLAKLEVPPREPQRPGPELANEVLQIDRPRTQELGALGLCEQQQVVDEPADAGDLGLHEGADAAHLASRGVALGSEQLELPADYGQRRAQLVRGTATKARCDATRR